MNIKKTKLDGVFIVTPPTIYEDFRGEYVETYNEGLYHEAGITAEFVQDDISVSYKHVLRGIHGDNETWKLVSCLYGRIWLVVVNRDTESPQFNQWEAFTLSDKNRLQVLIPPKFGNGHLVLSEVALFSYKQSTYYDRTKQFTVRFDDETLQIKWPVASPILSERDSCGV
jgi:dTDP-4-dehydrorhamnose 3,5-epimerase